MVKCKLGIIITKGTLSYGQHFKDLNTVQYSYNDKNGLSNGVSVNWDLEKIFIVFKKNFNV